MANEREDRPAYLRSLTNEELVHLVQSRWTAPEPDLVAESARRVLKMFAGMQPALARLQMRTLRNA